MPITKKVVTKKTAAKVEPKEVKAEPKDTTSKKVVAKKPTLKKVPAKKAAESVDVVVAEPAAVDVVVADAAADDQESSANDVFMDVLKDLATLTSSCKSLTTRVKALQKQVSKEHKELSKKGGKKKNNNGKPRAPSGFAKPSKITPELAKFLNVNENELFARTQVTKMITAYVKEHDLQLKENKKFIVPDAKLKKLLNNGNEEVSFFNLQKFMKVHYIKDPPAVAAST